MFFLCHDNGLFLRKKNNKKKKNKKKNKEKENGQVRADTEVVSAILELKNGRFPPRKNSPVRFIIMGKKKCKNIITQSLSFCQKFSPSKGDYIRDQIRKIFFDQPP